MGGRTVLGPGGSGSQPAARRGAVASWCLYDWANSAFTTLVVTFVYATYFSQTFAEDADRGTALWSRGITISSLIIAIISPLLGAMADRSGLRRRFLVAATAVSVGATAWLTFIVPGSDNAVLSALTLFVIANVGFEVGMVFYNAFLPQLSTPRTIGRISGYAWGLGYAGGLVCLVVALLGLIGLGEGAPWLPLSTEDGFNVRASNLLVAAWFLVFSLPALIVMRDEATPRSGASTPGTVAAVRGAFRDLGRTLTRIRDFRDIVRFLVARLIYNDGLITVFAFGGVYAAGTFGMDTAEVIVFGIALNVAAGLGAFLFGLVDDRLGGRTTVLWSLVGLFVCSLVAVAAPNKAWFWGAALVLGLFMGPNQSASRSLMGRFAPKRYESEFFGFFAFSGKATAFLGPLLLGLITAGYGQRAGIAVVLGFFLVGGLLLLRVDEARGIERAGRST
ncbi:MAG: MFS transporter [Holophagales bacterium]|nr:MFS transporter [Holophagales bacterium]MYH26822.1 MFS transporter [Holophagales bacterium]